MRSHLLRSIDDLVCLKFVLALLVQKAKVIHKRVTVQIIISLKKDISLFTIYDYRIQEVRDENYDPKDDADAGQRERSKSAPSGSPKSKKKDSKKKKNKIDQGATTNGAYNLAVVILNLSPVVNTTFANFARKCVNIVFY